MNWVHVLCIGYKGLINWVSGKIRTEIQMGLILKNDIDYAVYPVMFDTNS